VKNPIVPDKAYSPPTVADPVAVAPVVAPAPPPLSATTSEPEARQEPQAMKRRRSSISTTGKEVTVEVDMAPMTGGRFGRKNIVATINYAQCVEKMSNSLTGESLLSPMTEDEVYRRLWAQKRGHMVKNWKKRWFVLDRSEVRYYTREKAQAPFGEDLKGQVSIVFGSIDTAVEKDDKGVDIEVVIVRNTDKDLYMTFDEAADADAWIRSVREAIRRASMEVLATGPLQLLGPINTSLASGDVGRVSLTAGGSTSSAAAVAAGAGGGFTYKGEEWFMAQRAAYEETLLGCYFERKDNTRRTFRCRKHGFSADSKRCNVIVDISFWFSEVDFDGPPTNSIFYGKALGNCPAMCGGISWTPAGAAPGSSSSGKVSFADITDVISGSNSNGILDQEATLSLVIGKLSFCADFSAEGAANGMKGVFRDFTDKLVDVLRFQELVAQCNHFSTDMTPNPKNKKTLVINAQVSRFKSAKFSIL
jgi:hypothetical protein